jgi:hypothetical protein
VSGVVRRCPNCGTTTASPGECQACHQADVRYYCTNHTPGIWLDAPKCPECGAAFGDPVGPATPPPRVRRPVPPPAASPRGERSAPRMPERAAGPWVRRPRPPTSEDRTAPLYDSEKAPDPRVASWPDFLREAAGRARRMRAETRPVPDTAGVGMALGGCLLRAALAIVILLTTLLVFSLLFGELLFQSFGIYW